MIRQFAFVLLILFPVVLFAQTAETRPGVASEIAAAATQSAAQPQSSDSADDLAQMRTDLDQMESMLNNMSSEITFLRDQNLQILLNTNGRMWTILIRDLRRQIDRAEQHRAQQPQPSHGERPAPQSPPRQ